MGILETFYQKDIKTFIVKLNEQVLRINNDLEKQLSKELIIEEIELIMKNWKNVSSETIRKYYKTHLKTIKEEIPKPTYEEFMSNCCTELDSDIEFMEIFDELSNNMSKARSFIQSKIQKKNEDLFSYYTD